MVLSGILSLIRRLVVRFPKRDGEDFGPAGLDHVLTIVHDNALLKPIILLRRL